MGGVEYGRPLATGWTGTLGVNWQRARCQDEHGKALTQARRPRGSLSCPWPSPNEDTWWTFA
jgi:hypothetical protein